MTNALQSAPSAASPKLAEAKRLLARLKTDRARLAQEEAALHGELAPSPSADSDAAVDALLAGSSSAVAASRRRRAAALARLAEIEAERATLARALLRQGAVLERIHNEEGFRVSCELKPEYFAKVEALALAIEAALKMAKAVAEVPDRIRALGLDASPLALPPDGSLAPATLAILDAAAKRARSIIGGDCSI